MAPAGPDAILSRMDVDAFWEYDDPEASEARFRSALDTAPDDTRLEILTQIARTYGLRRRFGEARALLDEIAPAVQSGGPLPRVRWLLERGRAFHWSGEPGTARPLFVEAWQTAMEHGLDGLAVDAAHMIAIVDREPNGEWNALGLDLARSSVDPKARALLPAMLNNAAWDHHDAGRLDEALRLFREAEAAWLATGREPQGRIARWSVARCLRSLGRHAEALEIQLVLEREWGDDPDGYVLEEIAELHLALGRPDEGRPYFGRAAALLAEDPWLAEHEPERLARLEALGRRPG